MNSSMFLPQVAEKDIFNLSGQQQDDINTVVEYINKMILGNHLKVDQDEDDDSGQNFHIVRAVNYFFEPFFTTLEQSFTESKRQTYADFKEQKVASLSFDIISPPPDAV